MAPKRQLALPLEEEGSLVPLSKEAKDRGPDERLIVVSSKQIWHDDPQLAILLPPLSKLPQLESDAALVINCADISAAPRVAQFRQSKCIVLPVSTASMIGS